MVTETTASRTVCSNCGKCEVFEAVIAWSGKVKHDGKHHVVRVTELPVFQCAACDAVYMDARADEAIRHQLRVDLGLLQPDEIRAFRTLLALTQEQVEHETGIASETLCRWEKGRTIQSRASDRHLREFFAAKTFARHIDLSTSVCVSEASYSATPAERWHAVAPGVLLTDSSPTCQREHPANTQFALAA